MSASLYDLEVIAKKRGKVVEGLLVEEENDMIVTAVGERHGCKSAYSTMVLDGVHGRSLSLALFAGREIHGEAVTSLQGSLTKRLGRYMYPPRVHSCYSPVSSAQDCGDMVHNYQAHSRD